ncbi:MAG: TIGR04282 family arsenosugar biosynthesis glycosyltransferase [Candidatus Omnitrophica bacterium]|nr:TIGR04282 family arsenosugar biosynthesis glycosyltransferase [Candidatus Omnitrophota bacterium]
MPHRSNPGELILFVKYPEAGKVKTRLAGTTGYRCAAQIYSHMSRTVFWRMKHAGLKTSVAFHPPSAEKSVAGLFPDAESYVRQSSGDLGQKMKNALRRRRHHSGKLILIGTDCIDIQPDDCRQAFRELEHKDVVIGPAHDGGYYLLGIKTDLTANKQIMSILFDDIQWSTADVLLQTIRRLKRFRISHRLLKKKSDLDTADDINPAVIRSLYGPV